jgi:hypothetical protein
MPHATACEPLLTGQQQVLLLHGNGNGQQAPRQHRQHLLLPLPCHKHHQPAYEPLLVGGIGGADNDEWGKTNS